jgi:hypothetical protein
MSQSTDLAIKSTSRAYVVLDRGTGESLHILHAITFSQDLPVSENPAERGLRLAGAKAGVNVDGLEVDPALVNTLTPIQIDTAHRTVIPKMSVP